MSKPEWLKIRLPETNQYSRVASQLRHYHLFTICQEARCPNRSSCWDEGTATFLILGNQCTRNCTFCAVTKGNPRQPDPEEPKRIAEAVHFLGLRYAVITSVTRDDLPDGGASFFAATVKAVRKLSPSTVIELLIPDFRGSQSSLETILASRPQVISHNLETPLNIYPHINRPKDNYFLSLEIIRQAKRAGFITKSSLMVGLGESDEDIKQAMQDLAEAGCDLLSLGQYLQPTKKNLPVSKFYSPEEFASLENLARSLGFKAVAAGPLIRSSYLAHQLYARIS
ncbi:MAG: lipoyl synthase [Candidatus Aminicenantes bacterium]|nr:lipoyl synthase [Candidatus Aminicenantes bacterium]